MTGLAGRWREMSSGQAFGRRKCSRGRNVSIYARSAGLRVEGNREGASNQHAWERHIGRKASLSLRSKLFSVT
jgi:hypothetical protein